MTRKFKNRDPVGRPTPTLSLSYSLHLSSSPPSLSFSLFSAIPLAVRASGRTLTAPKILIDRSRFVSAKLILNAPRCSTMLRTDIWPRLNHSRRGTTGVLSRCDSTVTALSGRSWMYKAARSTFFFRANSEDESLTRKIDALIRIKFKLRLRINCVLYAFK